MFGNIPAEIREYPQFVLWRYEERDGKKPTKVPYSINGYPASVNNPAAWASFDQVVNAFSQWGEHFSGIGFVLTENDPFSLIDLDDPFDPEKGLSVEEQNEILERQKKIHTLFDSYSERSPSGKGLHIICKGSVPQGRKRSQVEVYSSQRFMTMTGDVFNNAGVNDRNQLLNELWAEMGKNAAIYSEIGDKPQTRSDQEICDAAYAASNGAKFLDLYKGDWQNYYTSQSEADFAFIDIIAFYTQNRAQISRIFRETGLAQRTKAFRDDYVEHMINRAFDRMLPPIDIDGLKIQIEAALQARKAADEQQEAAKQNKVEAEKTIPAHTELGSPILSVPSRKASKRRYPLPPGLLGEIASFIEAAAIRPVPEIALAGAIGLMSGVCGRAYNVSGTGLNTYTLLIAATGTGKEAMGLGIDKLITAASNLTQNVDKFIGPGQISSEQALSKHFHRHSKSFVAITGEIGLWLQTVCSPNAPLHLQGIKRAMLQLYGASAQGFIYKPTINSDKEKSTDASKAPAFSLLGESTPEEFYKILDEAMIASGLLPRFSIIEYRGKRPKKNDSAKSVFPTDHLLKSFVAVCINAMTLNQADKVIDVGFTDEAKAILEQFENFCDDKINGSAIEGGETTKQLWNRAALKAMKLAALVSVGMHHYTPTIDADSMNWAIQIVYDDICNILERFRVGNVGGDNAEHKQSASVVDSIADFIRSPFSKVAAYGVKKELHAERIIPFSFLQRRLTNTLAFKNDKFGSNAAIKRAIATLIDSGDIREVPRGEMAKLGTTQRGFMISNPETFIE